MGTMDPRIEHFLTYLEESWLVMGWIDVLDVCFIGATLSLFLVWIKRRAFVSLVMAVIPLIFVYLAATTLKMYLTTSLFQFGFLVLAIGIVVAFQEDFRRGIEGLASWRFQSVRSVSTPSRVSDILVEAVGDFSANRVGALIILKGHQPLKPYIRAGIAIDAKLSLTLLQSIFDPHSPGHDGAITLVGGKVGQMGVHLPLSRRTKQTGRLGTRHAAALGLVEACDALVLVVSEETGAISLARDGKLERIESAGAAKDPITRFLKAQSAPRVSRAVFHVPWVRLTGSFALAFMLWLAFVRPTNLVQRTLDVPILYRNLSSGWEAEPPRPSKVRITLLGPEGPMVNLEAEKLAASLDLEKVKQGKQKIILTDAGFSLPPRVRVKQISPGEVTVVAFPTSEAEVPVRVKWREGENDRVPNSSQVTIEPRTVKVRYPAGKTAPEFLETEAINRGAGGTVEVKVSPRKGLLDIHPPQVIVKIRR